MALIIGFVIAAAVLFVLLWLLIGGLVHLLVIGFWIVLVALVGFGLFRVGRRSRSRQ
jgi:hypothetical protein